MTRRYLQRHLTPAVLAAQRQAYGGTHEVPAAAEPDALGEKERSFLAARDSFYLASLTEAGAPYLQHRGGPPGFLRVLDPHTLVFADYAGNRQLLTTGHLRRDPRVALFLMDYPQRRRLKIDGLAEVLQQGPPAEPASLPGPGAAADEAAGVETGAVERWIRIRVEAFDWNCPQFITPRFSEAEVGTLLQRREKPLLRRIAELEEELRRHTASPGAKDGP